jgi:hypothetical protein
MKASQFAIALILLSIGNSVTAQHFVSSRDPATGVADLVFGTVIHHEPDVNARSERSIRTDAGSDQRGSEPWAALAYQGQPLPPGETGTLNPGTTFNPATVNGQGRVAFMAEVDGSARNQGIFSTDGGELKVIAMGCGAWGGFGSTANCGDPTPIGGTFSGMFAGTVFAPAINDAGDVLFYSDVTGGSSIRGLFLYRAATDDIIKIAAVGDASPLGGILSAIGPGSLNNNGRIAFLASTGGNGSQGSDILLWHEGVITKYVAAGDPAPDNETFLHISRDYGQFPDGTVIPDGPVPAINDNDQIAFFAETPSTGGHLLSNNGLHQWQVRYDDPAPGGGYYFDFRGAPVLNGRGKIAFLAYTSDSVGGQVTHTAWFVGSAGHFRRAIKAPDPLIDGVINGLAFSRNPFRPLDDGGNLTLWARRQLSDDSERETIVLSRADGGLDIIASFAEPMPLGGLWTYFNPWMTANNAFQIQFGAEVVGTGYTSAHYITTHFVDGILVDDFEGQK